MPLHTYGTPKKAAAVDPATLISADKDNAVVVSSKDKRLFAAKELVPDSGGFVHIDHSAVLDDPDKTTALQLNGKEYNSINFDLEGKHRWKIVANKAGELYAERYDAGGTIEDNPITLRADGKIDIKNDLEVAGDITVSSIRAKGYVIATGVSYAAVQFVVAGTKRWEFDAYANKILYLYRYNDDGTNEHVLWIDADGNVELEKDVKVEGDLKGKTIDDLVKRIDALKAEVTPYTGGAGIKIDGKTISATADDPAVKPVADAVAALQKNVDAIAKKVGA